MKRTYPFIIANISKPPGNNTIHNIIVKQKRDGKEKAMRDNRSYDLTYEKKKEKKIK